MTELFTPITLGAVALKNRVVMAPLTRRRADIDHVPTQMMVEHYSQRATAGLIIAEATMVQEGCSAFWREPGIYSKKQVSAWEKVTDAVHAKGGKIFLQIWHGGRACHPDLNDGRVPVAPSAIAIADEVHTPNGKKPYTVPRELKDDEIPGIVESFRLAAVNAQSAGFDGVEVHGANGYLLDQFLRDGSNQRKGPYGGTIENRARLLLEVLEAVCGVWGSDRVGLRLSTANSFNDMRDSDPVGLTAWLAQRLNNVDLAYLHLIRGDRLGEQKVDVVTPVREHYQGKLILNMGYSGPESNEAVRSGQTDVVAFGVPFIANPDLPERLQEGAPLNEADPATFYTHDVEGYNDYPLLNPA